MKKIAKTLTALLLAGTTLSLMCGCENGAADNKNSSVSGGNSATQSTTSDKSDASSKEEKQQEEKIEKLKQLPPGATVADAKKIVEGEPHDVYALYEIYYVGKYDVYISGDAPDAYFQNVYVQDIETKEWTSVLHSEKITNPYDKNNENYPDNVKNVVKKLSPITANSSREDVIKVLGEPSESYSNRGETRDIFKIDGIEVYATHFGKGLFIEIYDENEGLPTDRDYICNTTQVVYPDSFPIERYDEESSDEPDTQESSSNINESSSTESSDNQTHTIDLTDKTNSDDRTILKLNDERRNKIYDEKIEKIKQLPEGATIGDIEEIIDTPMAYEFGSGISYSFYCFGKYTVNFVSFWHGDVYNVETGESFNILYRTEPSDPYDENGNNPKEVKELAEKLSSITVDSTREDVIKALGEPDETDIEESRTVHIDTFNGDKYKIEVTYHGKGLLANIRTKDGRLYRNIVYPDRYKNKNNNSSQGEN